MRLIPRVFILAAIFLLAISYQNFSSVSPSDWDSTSSLKIINEMNAFHANDKQPSAIATPQGGSDFRSIRDDWMQRQGTIILNGYDKRLEAAMNSTLNSWVQGITKKDPEEVNGSGASTLGENSSEENSDGSPPSKSKQNLRFARVNSLKYDLSENTCMNLTADPGNTRFDLSQTLSRNAKFGVEHRTADSKTQMFLKYEW